MNLSLKRVIGGSLGGCPLLGVTSGDDSNSSLSIHAGHRDGPQHGCPQLLCSPVSTALGSALPWLKGPSGRGVSSAGGGAAGQAPPRASPNLLQEVPVVLGSHRGLGTRSGDWRGPQAVPQPRVPRPPVTPSSAPRPSWGSHLPRAAELLPSNLDDSVPSTEPAERALEKWGLQGHSSGVD